MGARPPKQRRQSGLSVIIFSSKARKVELVFFRVLFVFLESKLPPPPRSAAAAPPRSLSRVVGVLVAAGLRASRRCRPSSSNGTAASRQPFDCGVLAQIYIKVRSLHPRRSRKGA